MKKLDTNDWLVLNSIIYKIYTTEDERKMRASFLEHLKMIIDFDAADFYLASEISETGLVDPIAYNCDCVSGEYDELDYSRGILYSGKSMVYRETDIIDDEKRKISEYYKKVYKPNNWHYSMQIILARNKQLLGVATLYRT
ncbi:MAG TPA: helix-turn-helix transcriptional regulator, partial [Lachnospiraceae bacterium]|nr:helix-turn-helix transcriptional regulator [Lachnospiraceae bacterium]